MAISYTIDRYQTPDGERELVFTSLLGATFEWTLVDFAADEHGPVGDAHIVARGLRNCLEAGEIANVYLETSKRRRAPAWIIEYEHVDHEPYRRPLVWA